MDPRRSSVQGSSRLSNVFSPGSMSTPLGTSSRTLGKRAAAEAGIRDETSSSVSRRSYAASSSTSITTLQRRVIELEAQVNESEIRMEQQRSENERLRSERGLLLDGETTERETGERREKEWAEERIRLGKQIKDLRLENGKLSNTLAGLQSENSKLSNQHNALTLSSDSESKISKARIEELESEVDRLKGWERRAQGLSIELEEEKRRAEERRRGTQDEKEERGMEKTVREEMKRQATYLSTLRKDNATLQTELIELRQRKKDADIEERRSKDIERGLREEVETLHEQLMRARREMDSLTQSFPPDGGSPPVDASTLQHRLQALSALHDETTSELAAKNIQIQNLEKRISELAHDSSTSIAEWSRKANEAERELRWAKEGRLSAERREALAKKEVEALRSADDGPSMPGAVLSFGSGQNPQKIRQLEQLVETYKADLEAIQRDSRDVEDRLTQGAGLVKEAELTQSQAKVQELQTELDSLHSTITALTSANTTLDAEVNDLMRRVASGEYNPELERCLEMRNNPAAKIHTIRKTQLEALQKENQALLDRLKSVDKAGDGVANGQNGDNGGLVPRDSYDRLKREKEELEQAHAKRLLRLKEIFGNKSKEFLEAVYSLLGWRIKFDESGADIRLTSMYAPKGKMGLTLKFASQEGHFGTMQMTGAMAKGLEDTRHFWIVERQSVPGFLAQITTEMFEKTTIGRAAGYVGLE